MHFSEELTVHLCGVRSFATKIPLSGLQSTTKKKEHKETTSKLNMTISAMPKIKQQ